VGILDRSGQKGSRRPRSRTETEKSRRFVIVLLIVAAVVASVSVVGYGYYNTKVKPWNQRIVKVNGTVIEMQMFVKMLRLQQGMSSYYSSEEEWAKSVASALQQSELMRQGLEEFGVDVSDVINTENVEGKLREQFVSFNMIADNATEEEFQEAYKDAKKSLKKSGVSMEEYKRLAVEPELIDAELRKQIGDRDYPSSASCEHAQVEALLVSGSDNATQLRVRWEAGEAFDELKSEKAVSSSLGPFAADNTTIQWIAKGIKSEAFDNCTFSATPGVLSEVIQDDDDTSKYWVTKVLARESRALSESDRDTLVSKAYSKWLEEIMASEENDIIDYLVKKGGDAKLAFALDHVAVSS
jgi:hypothetical protein